MSERNTDFERALAEVLYESTTGLARPDVAWASAVQGMWLADASRILGAYQAEYAEAMNRTTTSPERLREAKTTTEGA